MFCFKTEDPLRLLAKHSRNNEEWERRGNGSKVSITAVINDFLQQKLKTQGMSGKSSLKAPALYMLFQSKFKRGHKCHCAWTQRWKTSQRTNYM